MATYNIEGQGQMNYGKSTRAGWEQQHSWRAKRCFSELSCGQNGDSAGSDYEVYQSRAICSWWDRDADRKACVVNKSFGFGRHDVGSYYCGPNRLLALEL